MKLIINNPKFEHITREIITAYFPKIKIDTVTFIPDNGDYITVNVTSKENMFCYYVTACIDSNLYNNEYTSCEENKLLISKAISDILKKVTGIDLPWGILTGIRPAKMVRELYEKGYNSSEVYELFTKNYDVHPDKSRLAIEVADKESVILNDMDKNAVSLYIGIPFCPTRCLYCSFTSQSIKYSNTLVEPYMDALFKEIDFVKEYINSNKLNIETIYVGGGTPTALNEYNTQKLCQKISESFNIDDIKEYTYEAGRPDTINNEKLKIIKNYGISRISINPQTMNDKTLKIIGRQHSANDIIKSFSLARDIGFNHINADLIIGLPDEDINDFKNTIKHLKMLNPESVTVHTMSIKHGSYLDMNYSMYTPTAISTVNSMLKIADEQLRLSKKAPYYLYRQKNMLGNLENVGYCNSGHECLYNIYIMEEVQSIISLGAGGSTKIINGNNIERVFNVKEVSEYIKRIDEMIDRKRNILKL